MVTAVNLRSSSNKDGTQTLRIRVTHDRKSKFITLFPIQAKFFNQKKQRISKSHPKSLELNLMISNEVNKINNQIEDLRVSGREISLDNLFNSKGNGKKLNFYIDMHMDYLESLNKFNSARKYKNLKDWIEKYKLDVYIKDINDKWVQMFYHYLEQQPELGSRVTINKYIKFLKAILRIALENNQEVHSKALNYKLPIAESFKTKLSIEEIQLISDFEKKKTGKKKKISINPAIKKIIQIYKGKSKFDYLLPWMDILPDLIGTQEYTKKIESKTAMINKQLKLIAAKVSIDKKLTTHVARHSFAHICLKQNLDLGQISELLNHSSPRTTQAYLKALTNQDELNEAANRITSLIS